MSDLCRFTWTSLALAALALMPVLSCSRSAGKATQGEAEQHAQDEAGHEEDAAGGAHEEHEGEEAHEEGVVELSPEAHARAGIETAAPELRPLGAELNTTGQVGFNEDRVAHVGPRISGRITAVRASLGQRVSRGETLAVLDSTELGQARAAHQRARVREELTRQTAEREARLAADKISSEQESLAARAAHLEAAAELRRSEETLRLMGLSASEIRTSGEPASNSSLSPVSSPFAGTVVDKQASLGEMVSPEQKLFTVADLSRLWVWIDIFEKDLRGVHAEDEVFVQVDSYPGETFEGKVSFLASSVDASTRAVRARIDVENRDGRLRPGMFARVRLSDPHVAASGPGARVVPESALQRQGDDFVVFVPDGERRYRRVEVAVGRRTGEWVEILSGLEAGVRVVVKGVFLLASESAKESMGEGHSH